MAEIDKKRILICAFVLAGILILVVGFFNFYQRLSSTALFSLNPINSTLSYVVLVMVLLILYVIFKG